MADRSDARRVFVGGLSYNTNEDRLREFFEQFGDVADALVMRNASDGRHRGFGFVRFAAKRSATRALSKRNVILDGREVEIKPATARHADAPAPPRSASSTGSPGAESPTRGRGSKRRERRQGGGGRGSPGRGGGDPGDASLASRKLFAGGLHYSTDEGSLREYFTSFGPVASAQVMYNRETNKSRGFGFVVFTAPASLVAALATTMHTIDGKLVEVKGAVPKGSPALATTPKPPPAAHPPAVPALAVSAPAPAPPAPAPAPAALASWAAVLAAPTPSSEGGEDSAHAATLHSGAESVTASVVSSILDDTGEGGLAGGTIPEEATVSSLGLTPLGLGGGDVWGSGALGIGTPSVAGDAMSVHSLESGLGSASVLSTASGAVFGRARADSQVSTRSEAASVTPSLAGSLPPPGHPTADAPGAPVASWGQAPPADPMGGAGQVPVPGQWGGVPAGAWAGGLGPPATQGLPTHPGMNWMGGIPPQHAGMGGMPNQLPPPHPGQMGGMPGMVPPGQMYMVPGMGGWGPVAPGGMMMGGWGMPVPGMSPLPPLPPPPSLPGDKGDAPSVQ